MRSGQCPKCHSTTVYTQTSGIFFHQGTIHVRTSQVDQGIPFVSFICTSCGYFENYVADQTKLADVAKAWVKVPAV